MPWKKATGRFKNKKDMWESDSHYLAVNKSHVRFSGYDVIFSGKAHPREVTTLVHKPTRAEARKFAKKIMRERIPLPPWSKKDLPALRRIEW